MSVTRRVVTSEGSDITVVTVTVKCTDGRTWSSHVKWRSVDWEEFSADLEVLESYWQELIEHAREDCIKAGGDPL